MICDWCDQEATKAGKRPLRTNGPDYLKSCDRHERWIVHLGYELCPLTEAEMAERRAQLRWPRAWAQKQDPMLMYFDYGWGGDYYLVTDIPPKLKDAQCELALVYLNAGTIDPASPTGLENLKTFEIGPLKMEMNQPVSAAILPDEVARLLRGLRVSAGSLQRN